MSKLTFVQINLKHQCCSTNIIDSIEVIAVALVQFCVDLDYHVNC